MNELQASLTKMAQPIQTNQMIAAANSDSTRAAKEVEAALIIGKRFPRDMFSSEQRIVESCKRYSLAERAVYSFPRGDKKVEGPSIRLAEVLANSWGNIHYGFKEIEQVDGKSHVESFCWDVETNTKITRQFTVTHKIQLKNGGVKNLTDPRDIYEMVANQAQRRVRACILEVIPGDIVENAVKMCKKTLEIGQRAEPLIDRVRKMVTAFTEVSVTKEMLEERLGHPIDNTTSAEIAEMQSIYNSIRDGISSREDWFTTPTNGPKPPSNNAESIAQKLAQSAPKVEEPPKYAAKPEPTLDGILTSVVLDIEKEKFNNGTKGREKPIVPSPPQENAAQEAVKKLQNFVPKFDPEEGALVDPGEYRFDFGPLKGRTMKDIEVKEIYNVYLKYQEHINSGKETSAPYRVQSANMRKYLRMMAVEV